MLIAKGDIGTIKRKQILNGYKASRFNIFSEGKEGQLILFNTYTKKLVQFPSHANGSVRDVLKNPDATEQESDLFGFLFEREFFVSNSSDEFRRADMVHQETIPQEGTLSLIILPNEDCNFRCTYCYESFSKNFMKESVQNGINNYIRKNIKKYARLHVEWFGGEPLTAVPIVERLSKENG
ncbi:4Fe-4S cluster-binding domain-containing protein [Paenibacillus sp. MZ03-122A]|uniref:4Fe-4S cluster-binding domain-containing protein n=1 Tax=Paenibacillus sp. MZ03-122A TaxID=2962033 RepID=UPI0020B7AD86|nr:4Fe-4S cluster-binding domain-containing protein [Paenibacillus sp. MZ03-122A]MCP3781446.1 4Fe-4S cluster-binding domain-containing protein [Paenibacillus sp. MZ03-122A]